MRFKNKIALVTGTDSGIGKQIVNLLQKEGCKVIAGTTKKMKKKNIKHIYSFNLDVTKEHQWKEAYDFINNKFGKLHILVNNAGIRISGNIENTSLELWNRIINTNITSMFLGCKYIVPILKKTKNTSIINLASITSIRGVRNMLAYSSSKGAIVSFTASLALDLIKHGIRVNAVAPGAVDTQMIWSLKKEIKSDKNFNKRIMDQHPIGRVAKPKEIATVVVFLASDESSFMTGLTIPVDGGRSIR